MTLNDFERHNDLILRYFTKFGSFQGVLCKSVRALCHHKKVHVRYLITWWVSCLV